MAMLAAKADGNLTDAATWALVDPTSFGDAIGSTQGISTSYLISATFTPGAIQIDGIAFYVSARLSTAGTITAALDQGGADVAGTVVTVNAADVPAGLGWMFFKFAAPVTLLAATAYAVKIKSSTGTPVSLYRVNSTSGNWARYLRTTTTQAPVAADMLCVTGEYTGAGTSNTRTVTMNDAAAGATVYGQVDVCSKGTLSYGVVAATNYHLKLAGNLNVNAGGTFNIGTSGTPIPSDSTAVLEFACASNVQYGLELRELATCTMRGATKTVKAFLAADVAGSSSRNFTTDVVTGWKASDVLGFASTSRTFTETETQTLQSDTVGTAGTIVNGLGFDYSHSGTNPTRAEVANLTRNVKVRGASSSLQTYVNIAATAVYDFQYTEFQWLGSVTSNKRGIDAATSTGTGTVRFCSLRDFAAASAVGFNINSSSANNITFSDNVIYSTNSYGLNVPAIGNTTPAVIIDNNLFLRSAVNIIDLGITFTNNVAAGGFGIGISIAETAVVTGTFSGNVSHSNSNYGFNFSSMTGGVLGSLHSWRNNTYGVLFDNLKSVTFDSPTIFGNGNIGYIFNSFSVNVTLKNPVSYGGSVFTQGYGIYFNASCYGLLVEGGSFGSPSAHTAGDVGGLAGAYVTAVFHNTLFASSSEVVTAQIAALGAGSRIASQRHDQTAGLHKAWLREGVICVDTTIADASPSQRLIPALASEKLKSGRMRVAVLNGQTVTFTVKVRKSAAGDGTAYNGSQPRLMLEKNVAAGVAADAVLATAAAAAGAWEMLTGTTPAAQGNTVFTFYVDCDGTTGWVNVDTAGAS